jgi:hypothetical protein
MEGVTVIRPHYLAWGWENLETMLFVGGYNRARQQKSVPPTGPLDFEFLGLGYRSVRFAPRTD